MILLNLSQKFFGGLSALRAPMAGPSTHPPAAFSPHLLCDPHHLLQACIEENRTDWVSLLRPALDVEAIASCFMLHIALLTSV